MNKLSFDKANSSSLNIYEKLRSHFYLKFKNVKYGSTTYVKKNVQIKCTDNAKIEIGKNCLIQENSFILLTKPEPALNIGNNVNIGRGCIISIKDKMVIGNDVEIGPNVSFFDQNHQYEKGKLIREQLSIIKKIKIGNDCWIGSGSIILKGVEIGNGSVIGSGSIVNKSIPEMEIWAGNPAKFIKKRL